MKKLALSLLVVAAVAAAWFMGRSTGQAESTAATPSASRSSRATAPMSASAPAPASPARLIPAVAATRAPARPSALTPLGRDFQAARNYKALYDRLKGTAEGSTPEGEYYLAQILRACATIADGRGAVRSNSARIEERKQDLLSQVPESDPRRAQRLAAFDKLSTDKCQGLDGLAATDADIATLMKSAMAGGDPKARAYQVEQDMWTALREARAAGQAGPGTGVRGPTLTDAQLASLRESVNSRDPEAIAIAGRVLASPFRDLTVRIGPDQDVIENRVFNNALQMVACDYGYPCADNNQRLLNACAYLGHCGVTSLNDYLAYYGGSPYDSTLLDQYRNIVRQAVDTGDWSQLTVQRGARSNPGPVPASPGGSPFMGGR